MDGTNVVDERKFIWIKEMNLNERDDLGENNECMKEMNVNKGDKEKSLGEEVLVDEKDKCKNLYIESEKEK